jgi:general secretion pathway protein A
MQKSPFPKDIPAKDIFLSDSVKELNQRLEHMKQKKGIMLITGESGVGKTLILRGFKEKLNPNLYQCCYIPLSTVSVIDFYRQISLTLGGEDYSQKAKLFASIQESIKDYVVNTKRLPIIILDESHMLKNENFWELQIITNFQMDSLDPALFILTGQSHLRERLLRPTHRSLYQRITLKYHLIPLSKEETILYIQHHLKLAGLAASIFTENALEAIYQNSSGIARIINSLALKTMTIGALERKDMLTEEEVYRASKEL